MKTMRNIFAGIWIVIFLIGATYVGQASAKDCTPDGGRTIIVVGDNYACPSGTHEI